MNKQTNENQIFPVTKNMKALWGWDLSKKIEVVPKEKVEPTAFKGKMMRSRSFLIRQKWGKSFHHVHKRFNLWAAVLGLLPQCRRAPRRATPSPCYGMLGRALLSLLQRRAAGADTVPLGGGAPQWSAHFSSPLHIFPKVHQVHKDSCSAAFDQSFTAVGLGKETIKKCQRAILNTGNKILTINWSRDLFCFQSSM